MADFRSDLQNFKQSFPLLDIDPTMESLNEFGELNQSVIDNSALMNFQSLFPFSNVDSLIFSNQEPDEVPCNNWEENLPAAGFSHLSNQGSVLSVAAQPNILAAKTEFHESKKRKSLDASETSSGNSSSPQVSESGIKRRNNSGRGKRAKSNDQKEGEKPEEVVHVRARRGQATDSHSLAERVRRGKINERLRCLQDIVPGCYKTMGIAVMLDEIINYVQSLQNQVEFLSMKLTAASTYYDFNSESDAMERMQREKAQEAKEIERLMREEYVGGLACFHSSTTTTTWSSLT